MGLRGLLGSDEAEEHSESRGEWNENSFPAWDSEEDALNVARTDARQSLDQTIHTIRDIDETAMSTLRIDLIIIGLVLTAVTSVPATLRLGNVVSILGFVSILGSALLALVTNIGSNYPTGISADYLREFRASSWSEREWNEWMIREYESWLTDASQMADGDARALFYKRGRPSASGLDPEGEGRRKIKQATVRIVDTVRNSQRRVKDLNPTLTETVWKCDSSQNPRLWRGATGVVGRGGAADPHGRTGRSGVNSSRPISGRSGGIKFACDGMARFGACGQDGEAAGLVPAVLHTQLTLALGIVLLVAGILLGVTGRPPIDPLVEIGNRSVRATGSTFYVGPQYVRV